jgi:hypothetical protein
MAGGGVVGGVSMTGSSFARVGTERSRLAQAVLGQGGVGLDLAVVVEGVVGQ